MSRVARLLRHTTIATLLVTGAATVGGFFAAAAWPLELMCHFRAQYAAVLLVCCCVLITARYLWWSAIAVCLAMINAWVLWPYVPLSSAEGGATNPSPGLKLISINVYSGNPHPERVTEFLRAQDADVIVAFEVTSDWERRFGSLHDRYPHRVVQSRKGNFGIAVYSARPLEAFRFVPLGGGNDAIECELRVNETPWTLLAAHPFPPAGAQGLELRNRQLRALGKAVANARRPCVAAGDFNVTPFSPAFQELLEAGELNDPREATGLAPTWPVSLRPLRIPIDHCLVSSEIEARVSVGPDVGSDHLPLVAQLRLR